MLTANYQGLLVVVGTRVGSLAPRLDQGARAGARQWPRVSVDDASVPRGEAIGIGRILRVIFTEGCLLAVP